MAGERIAMDQGSLGRGVHSPRDFVSFSTEKATVVRMYSDQDLSLVVWNLEPGQENGAHHHPESAHTLIVLDGHGEYLRHGDEAVPIKAGDCVIVPRGAVHGIRNTAGSAFPISRSPRSERAATNGSWQRRAARAQHSIVWPRRRAFLWHCQVRRDCLQQVLDTKWLGQEPGGIDFRSSVRRHRGGREDDYGRVRTWPLAIGTGELPAVHDRHRHVEKDQRRLPLPGHLQGLCTLRSNLYLVAQ